MADLSGNTGEGLDIRALSSGTDTLFAVGSVNVVSTVSISGGNVWLDLLTGSSIVVALPSGTAFTYIAPIANTKSWVASVSGVPYWEVTGISGTNINAHLMTSGAIFAQDMTPNRICIRVPVNTSGIVEMWAP